MWKAKRMAGDLGGDASEVHAEAQGVLDFWFRETPPEKRFKRDPAFDAECARRFKALRDRVLADGAESWAEAPDTSLAAVILIDQFSRNIYRGEAEAFAGDALARELSERAIARGWDRGMTDEEKQFLYMPFMHAEDAAGQARSVALFGTLGGDPYRFALMHKNVIERFGRFPGRNAALGRADTPEEARFLADEPQHF